MPSQFFDLGPDFDGQVRLFPLSDLVMFPSNLLPLHIFESRYREMLEDAIRGDQLIAMATLLPGFEHEYYTRAPIAPTVCIGRVTDYDKSASGTYDLMLLGLRRAEIESEIEPVRSFRRARVKLLGDPPSHEPCSQQELAHELAERIRESLPAAEKLVQQFLEGDVSLASFTDILAFHLPLPTELKLALLAETKDLVRAEQLLANLSAFNQGQKEKRYPLDFSNN